MKRNLASLRAALEALVWEAPEGAPPRAWLIRLLRLSLVLGRDLAGGQLTLRAMGLVYTTLLSIVPLLALSFSVLKAFGVYNQIQPVLLRFLEPLGDKGTEIAARIVQFIQHINVGVLGSAGLALLLYTAVSLVQKVEESFNYVWHVGRARSLGERFSRYLTALLVGPLLVFSAMGITAAAASLGVVREAVALEPVGWLATQAARLVPYVLVVAAFTFIYTFIPNTTVRLRPALVGGVVGGVLWQSAGWAFALFAAGSTRYSAIYSGFALLILFMLWLYLSWLILVFGASVAFYAQHPEYLLAKGGEPQLSGRMRERLALLVMARVAQRHIEGAPPWTADALAQALRVPALAVDSVLAALRSGGILAAAGDEATGVLPARDLGAMDVKQVLDAVRGAGEQRALNAAALRGSPLVEDLLRRYEEAAGGALGRVPVRELGMVAPPSGSPPP